MIDATSFIQKCRWASYGGRAVVSGIIFNKPSRPKLAKKQQIYKAW